MNSNNQTSLAETTRPRRYETIAPCIQYDSFYERFAVKVKIGNGESAQRSFDFIDDAKEFRDEAKETRIVPRWKPFEYSLLGRIMFVCDPNNEELKLRYGERKFVIRKKQFLSFFNFMKRSKNCMGW